MNFAGLSNRKLAVEIANIMFHSGIFDHSANRLTDFRDGYYFFIFQDTIHKNSRNKFLKSDQFSAFLRFSQNSSNKTAPSGYQMKASFRGSDSHRITSVSYDLDSMWLSVSPNYLISCCPTTGCPLKLITLKKQYIREPESITSLMVIQNIIWIATSSGILYSFHKKKKDVLKITRLGSIQFLYGLLPTQDGVSDLWSCSTDGDASLLIQWNTNTLQRGKEIKIENAQVALVTEFDLRDKIEIWCSLSNARVALFSKE